MINSGNDDAELVKAMQRLHNREYYLEKLIKNPLQETFKLLCDEHGLLDEFIDVVLLLIFAHIDLLGRLYAGEAYRRRENTTKNAVLFMEKYFGRVDERYKEVSGLLYHALRHGYVHVFTPKRIGLQNGEQLDFSFTTHHKNIKYLSLRKMKENEISGSAVIRRLNVHVSQLYQDLLIAIDKYAGDIACDQDISDRFRSSFISRRIEDTEEELRKKDSNLGSGFDYIYRQTPDSH